MLLEARQGYSRAEWISDAVVHIPAVVMALVAVPVLITLAVFLRGDFPAVASTTLYGIVLVLMLVFSALYKMTTRPHPRRIFRSFDHTAILCKIAATFTLLSGVPATGLLAGLWTAALGGAVISRRITCGWPRWRLRWAGWASLRGPRFFAELAPQVLALIVIGGLLYTLGVAFFLLDRLPFHYTIWHVCVLAASAVFYAAVTVQLVQTA